MAGGKASSEDTLASRISMTGITVSAARMACLGHESEIFASSMAMGRGIVCEVNSHERTAQSPNRRRACVEALGSKQAVPKGASRFVRPVSDISIPANDQSSPIMHNDQNIKEETMTVDEMKSHLGIQSDYALAKHLGVSKQAVSQWRQKGRVPEERAEKAAVVAK